MRSPNSVLYLDHAATTPLRPAARDAMGPFFGEEFGNPSGFHSVSRSAKAALEEARESAAAILGADHPLDVVFTGSGTESDNLGVAGPVLAGGGGLVTTAVEHSAVLETAAFLHRLGTAVAVVGVDADGVVDPEAVAAAVEPGTGVVSVMTANNETGVLQPVAEVARAVKRDHPEVLIHTDAVQAFESSDVTLESLGADMVTLASHKFGGPKGVGLLHVRRDVSLEPVVHGGGQEIGRRSGTPDVAGIVGMVAAMEAAVKDRDRFTLDVGAARDAFEVRVAQAFPDAVFTAATRPRLVQHSHLRLSDVDSEALLIRLDRMGVAAGTGSACHSGAVEASHVLAAMGLAEDATRSSVRFSFGWTSRPSDGSDAAAAVIECTEALR